MYCQVCGAMSSTTHVAFYQNIGALIIRWHKSIKGEMCERCVHRFFWEYTLVNLTLGWWGVVSLIVTPFFVINNVARYLFAVVKLRTA